MHKNRHFPLFLKKTPEDTFERKFFCRNTPVYRYVNGKNEKNFEKKNKTQFRIKKKGETFPSKKDMKVHTVFVFQVKRKK